MTQDFAKIQPEPILDRKPPVNQPTRSFLLTGMILGLVVGVFGCFLFYLSGRVPPLPQAAEAAVVEDAVAEVAAVTAATEPVEEELDSNPQLELEFYQELPNYEVEVDTAPVEIAETQLAPQVLTPSPQQNQTQQTRYMLQSGAFQQRESAQYQKSRLETLGMTTTIKEQTLPGRTLYLVQSGPFFTRAQVSQAEQVLRDNSITSMRISLN